MLAWRLVDAEPVIERDPKPANMRCDAELGNGMRCARKCGHKELHRAERDGRAFEWG